MTSRRRNYAVLAGMLALLVLALGIVIPGTPLSKETKLGLDLSGGVELVYQGRPTPKVPEVTPQAVDDAIETIRKRTDALGVSEPEIQRAGADQISIGLPNVENADRAIEQVGTTAQLQFYDWEPNVIGNKDAPIPSLFEAVERASRQTRKAEPEDRPPGAERSKSTEAYDTENDSTRDKYFLFDKNQQLLGPDGRPFSTNQPFTGASAASCKELLADFEPRGEPGSRKYAKDTQCADQLRALGQGGPPAESRVLKVPQGIVVVRAERPEKLPAGAPLPEQYYVLEDDSELSGAEIKNPEQNFDPNTQEPIVTMDFTDRGRKAFANVTKRIAQRGSEQILPPGTPRSAAFQRFAITLDNQIVSLATIDFVENPEGIDGRTGAQINGIGTITQTQDLAESLRIGALPIELKLISQTQVSATLGQQALDEGLLAGGAGMLLTILFLVAFYRVLGLVAGVTLMIYGTFLFALVKLIPITLTLPGIAGMILTLGVAADANIVIFERVKEEVRTGLSIPRAISTGYTKAFRTILDANVVTILVAFILFMVATAGVKGFAFTLGLGTIISLFTAVLATSAILATMGRSRLLASRAALGAKGEGRPWRFDFTGRSRWFFSASGAIIAAGSIAIAGLGINFGIDFESGTRIKTPLERAASTDQVRDALAPLGFDDAKIQDVDDPALGQNAVQIQTPTLGPEEVTRVQAALNEEFGVDTSEFTSSSVGPTFGAQIARTALIAIVASLLLISIYIGLRFEFKFAVPVLIAIAHDILITAGVYALTEREVTASTIAALLTILGYSLYDTIIVFDRIRENVPRMPRAAFSQIVNRSMSEVLTRSLVTTLCTLLPVVTLLLFGGETLTDFAFAIMIGIASGTYSSIFIASPVLVAWKEREPAYVRRRRLVMDEHGGRVPAYATGRIAEEGEPAPEPRTRMRGRRKAPAGPGDGVGPPAAASTDSAPSTDPGGRPAPRAPEPPAPEPRAPEPAAPDPQAPRTLVEEASRPGEPLTPAPDAGAAPAGQEGDGAPRPPRPPKKQKRGRPRKKHGRR